MALRVMRAFSPRATYLVFSESLAASRAAARARMGTRLPPASSDMVTALAAPAPAAPKLLALSSSLDALAYLAAEIMFMVLVIFWMLVTDLIRMPSSFSLPDEYLTD